MKRFLTMAFVLGVMVLATSVAVADVPQTINYQGRLTDATGAVVDGGHLIKFKIYGSAAGDDSLWWSGFQIVQVDSGLFEYQLGGSVQLPDDLFETDTSRYLGITIGVDPEIAPRVRMISAPYAYQALRADSADYADNSGNLGGQSPSYYLAWSNLTGVPAGFADGIDDVGSSDWNDLTNVPADIADGDDVDTDWNNLTDVPAGFADGIDDVGVGDIAANQDNHFTLNNYFDAPSASVQIGDSTFRADNNGVRIGDGLAPISSCLLYTRRTYNTPNPSNPHYSNFVNTSTGDIVGNNLYVGVSPSQGNGPLYGFRAIIGSSSGSTDLAYGVYADVDNNFAGGADRYGVQSFAGHSSNTTGISYGVKSTAYGGTYAYGIHATAAYGTTASYAGYFEGNVYVNGTLSKAGGSFKIDHPLDPEHKYLQHSFVESPDMMNVYNGNVMLDGDGAATVTLPDYFEVLNMDFRYQLTAIGAPGPNLYIADKINGNQFRIAGGEMFGEVSWQVTGIRQDKWAQAHRIQVEVDKPITEIGTYLSPEEHGQPIEKHVNYEEMKEDIAQAKGRGVINEDSE